MTGALPAASLGLIGGGESSLPVAQAQGAWLRIALRRGKPSRYSLLPLPAW
jgi:hypothetical protein